MTKNLAYGIDFGTTNSTVAVSVNGKVQKIPIDSNNNDKSVMRSVIYVSPDNEFSYGNSAIENYLNSVKDVKEVSFITLKTGRLIKVLNSNNTYETVEEIADVELNPNGRLLQSLKSALGNKSIQKINFFGKTYLIEELIGMYLKEIKTKADNILGEKINKAVFGRPVKYVGANNELSLSRMKKAIEYAGFTNYKFEFEPIGAAYDYQFTAYKNQKVLIFDFGGGTLDVSILEYPNKNILSNVGLDLGGDKFNSQIFSEKLSKYFGSNIIYGMSQSNLPRFIFNSLESWYGITLLKTKDFYNQFESFSFRCSDIKSLNFLKSLVFNNLGFKLYENIENVKKYLSISKSSEFKFSEKDINIITTIYKMEFEMMILDDLTKIKNLITTALNDANLNINEIDKIVTTGGSSLIPSVKSLLVIMFGEEKIVKSDTFTSVATGLAKIAEEF